MKSCLSLQAPGPPRPGVMPVSIIGAEDEDFENELEAVSRIGWESPPSFEVSTLSSPVILSSPNSHPYSFSPNLSLTPQYDSHPFFPATCPYCQGCSRDISTHASQDLPCLGAIEKCQGLGRASLRGLFFPCGTQLPCLHPPELRRSKQPVPEPGAGKATPGPSHGPPAACGPAV